MFSITLPGIQLENYSLFISFLYVLLIVPYLYSIYHGIYDYHNSDKKSSQKTSSTNRKNRDKIINELRIGFLKNSASIESFGLMVGALMKKVDDFEKKLSEISLKCDQDINSIRENTDSIKDNTDKIIQVSESRQNKINLSFQRIQHNFSVMDEKLKNFTSEEYHQFCKDISAEIKTLHDAIFVPLDDSSEDSSFENKTY